MGSRESKSENAGTVINQVDIQPATIENIDVIICLYIITVLSIASFLYKIYKIYFKKLKKKYTNVAQI